MLTGSRLRADGPLCCTSELAAVATESCEEILVGLLDEARDKLMLLCGERVMPTDEELMLAARSGDLGAFEQLVLRHQQSAWNAAYRFAGDAAEAEDVAQEAFLKILNAAPHYRPTASFRTYLYRVVTRLCLDRVRKKHPAYTEDHNEVTAREPSALENLIKDEQSRAVRTALDSLPPAQRMAAVLRYYEGLSYAEIAVAMENTQKGIERLLARARATLEAGLQDLL